MNERVENDTERVNTKFFGSTQKFSVSKPTNNVNNRIINVDDLPELHEEERRIGNIMMNNTMTMCHRRLKALLEMKGRDDFGIMCVMDECGESPPNGTIELIQVWHNDRQNQFEVTLEREDFWFRNAAM